MIDVDGNIIGGIGLGLLLLFLLLIILNLIVNSFWEKYRYVSKSYVMVFSLWILLTLGLVLSLLGLYLTDQEHDKRKYEFTPSEISMIESKKPYADFTDKEKQAFVMLKGKYLLNREERVAQYHDRVFDLAVDEYLFQNSHRKDLTREMVKGFVTKDWNEKRQFYEEQNYIRK